MFHPKKQIAETSEQASKGEEERKLGERKGARYNLLEELNEKQRKELNKMELGTGQ